MLRLIVPLLEDSHVLHEGRDWKTEVTELASRHGLGPVRYAVAGTGPDHDRHFSAEVQISGRPMGRGEGSSKKAAERAAAAAACEAIARRCDAGAR